MSEKHFVVILEVKGQPGNVIGPFPTENDAFLWGVIHGAYSAMVWEVMSPEEYAIDLNRQIVEALKNDDFSADD